MGKGINKAGMRGVPDPWTEVSIPYLVGRKSSYPYSILKGRYYEQARLQQSSSAV